MIVYATAEIEGEEDEQFDFYTYGVPDTDMSTKLIRDEAFEIAYCKYPKLVSVIIDSVEKD